VLGIDRSERRPSLRRCLELRLEDSFAQGGRRRTSDAKVGGLGRSNDGFSLVWRREEQSGSNGAEAGSKASRGGENGLASMTAYGRQWIRTARARGQQMAEHGVEHMSGSCRTRMGRRPVTGCEQFNRLLRLTSGPGFILIFQ
jgi:hypothetical protein